MCMEVMDIDSIDPWERIGCPFDDDMEDEILSIEQIIDEDKELRQALENEARGGSSAESADTLHTHTTSSTARRRDARRRDARRRDASRRDASGEDASGQDASRQDESEGVVAASRRSLRSLSWRGATRLLLTLLLVAVILRLLACVFSMHVLVAQELALYFYDETVEKDMLSIALHIVGVYSLLFLLVPCVAALLWLMCG